MERLKKLFEQCTGETLVSIDALPMAGSNRRYFRMKSGHESKIGIIGTSVEENRAFCLLAEHFKSKGLNVPTVFAHDEGYSCYLQEDLGSVSLFDLIGKRAEDESVSADSLLLLHKTMEALPDIQFFGAEGLDFSICYPQSAFDKRTVFWDLNYFKYNFLKALPLDFKEDLLENDFETLAEILLESGSGNTFLYRDFQSRNVMVKDGVPFFIDFQGGRRGPIYYDVASFLWQAKACFSTGLRQALLQTYLNRLQTYQSVDVRDFQSNLSIFVLFRTLQVLGAYGYRGYFEKKSHFLQSIPFAIDNLREVLAEIDCSRIPYLHRLLTQMTALPRFERMQDGQKRKKMTVNIYSFSYRNGIPDDFSGNGGGYVFDCRAVHNPGRYEPYKQLMGLDEPVIRFLEDDGEILEFLESVYQLADKHVECYLERGFSNLMFSFGCTGGQHRSVYSAQHLAEHLFRKYPIRVELFHREQNLSQVFDE